MKGDYSQILKLGVWDRLPKTHRPAKTRYVVAFTTHWLINGAVRVFVVYPTGGPKVLGTIRKAHVLGKNGWKVDLKQNIYDNWRDTKWR